MGDDLDPTANDLIAKALGESLDTFNTRMNPDLYRNPKIIGLLADNFNKNSPDYKISDEEKRQLMQHPEAAASIFDPKLQTLMKEGRVKVGDLVNQPQDALGLLRRLSSSVLDCSITLDDIKQLGTQGRAKMWEALTGRGGGTMKEVLDLLHMSEDERKAFGQSLADDNKRLAEAFDPTRAGGLTDKSIGDFFNPPHPKQCKTGPGV